MSSEKYEPHLGFESTRLPASAATATASSGEAHEPRVVIDQA
jgi:hypothetical protein